MSAQPAQVPDDETYELHENKLRDIVNYCRSGTIRNEQQFALLMLAYTTGLQRDPQGFVSAVIIGTSSAGKSHVKQEGEELLTHLDVYSADSGSEKSMIHDDDWNDSDVVSMGELQQPPEELVEFLKRVHGGDEQFEYSVTMGSMRDGFESETIVKDSKPYVFTYAQFDPDFEMWNRLLKIPAHESESKNRAVMRMAAGRSGIEIGGDDEVYGYRFERGTQLLQDHMQMVRDGAPDLWAMPAEADATDLPLVDIMEPVFNHSRSESNRIYWMVFNLIGASALLNFEDREIVTKRYDGQDRPAVAVEAQDVANIIRLRPALLATTHELDQRKRAVLQAIQQQGGRDNTVDGLEPIRDWLQDSDASQVNRDQLEHILADLESNFLLEINEDAGENGDLYRAYELDQLGVPNVDDHREYFEDCTCPLTGKPFLEVWDEQRERNLTSADNLLAGADDDVSSDGFSSGGSDSDDPVGFDRFDESTETVDVSPTARALARTAAEHLDGVRIEDLSDVPIEGFIGLVDPNDPDLSTVDTDGTLLDPDHDVWDREDRDDSWVTMEKDARRALTDAVDELIDAGVITFSEIHEQTDAGIVDATLAVNTDRLA